ncbi:MAG TPA: DNA cytosine methyltransferase [Ktedonobacteraceae bacterium]|nr:DNA cytosine methyltransferase [Ktedonobacteraceae bacterium]
MRHLDLFSGIGSWALAAQHVWRDDYECVGFCETDWFCRMVLQKNFPGVPIYGDIRTLTDTNSTGLEGSGRAESPLAVHRGHVSLISASPPCQAASQAGRRQGKADDRWLWPQTFDVIRDVRPTFCILENVPGLLSLESGLVFEELCVELENIGYSVQTYIIPAVALNAPHRRDRVWLIAHSLSPRSGDKSGDAGRQRWPAVPHRTDRLQPSDGSLRPRWPEAAAWERDWREVAASTCVRTLDDGNTRNMVKLPDGTSISEARWRKEALKAVGNAIVPAVAVEIMKAIKAADQEV